MKKDYICKHPSCNMFAVQDYCIVHSPLYKNFKESKEERVEWNPDGYTSQISLFKDVWRQSDKICPVSHKSLSELISGSYRLHLFAHILRKSAFKEMKYYKKNIAVVHPEVHELFDNAVLSKILKYEKKNNANFEPLFRMEEELYNEYASVYGKVLPIRKIVDRYFASKL